MSKAEERANELWKQYQIAQISADHTDRQCFIEVISAALHEYGAIVRKRDAEVCRNAAVDTIGGDDYPLLVFNKTRKECAAAIEREPLP